MNKNLLLLFSLLIIVINTNAQNAKDLATEAANNTEPVDIINLPNGWKKKADFVVGANWMQADKWVGASDKFNIAVSINAAIKFEKKQYKTLYQTDIMILQGGLLSTSTNNKFRKAQDQCTVNFTIATQMIPKLFSAWRTSVVTQLLPTYSYDNGVQGPAQSTFLTPGVLRTGLGIVYKPNSLFKIYLSPISANMNTKINRIFFDQNYVGVDSGKTYRLGWGALMVAEYSTIVKKKFSIKSKVELYTDYTRKPFTVIDVDWINSLSFPLTKKLAISFVANTRYYHFILPRIQYMHIVGLSGSFSF
jgi:hypothetical protein